MILVKAPLEEEALVVAMMMTLLQIALIVEEIREVVMMAVTEKSLEIYNFFLVSLKKTNERM